MEINRYSFIVDNLFKQIIQTSIWKTFPFFLFKSEKCFEFHSWYFSKIFYHKLFKKHLNTLDFKLAELPLIYLYPYGFKKKFSKNSEYLTMYFFNTILQTMKSDKYEIFTYKIWKFSVKKSFDKTKTNFFWLERLLTKLIPWKKKLEKRKIKDERHFFQFRKFKKFPFWLRKQVWLQYWYVKNLELRYFYIRELIFLKYVLFINKRSNRLIFWLDGLNFFKNAPLRCFNLLLEEELLFFTLLRVIKNTTTTFYYWLVLSRKDFFFGDTNKLLVWKKLKWYILACNISDKSKFLKNDFIFQIITKVTVYNNFYVSNQNFVENLIKVKKKNSILKKSVDISKHIAYTTQYLTKTSKTKLFFYHFFNIKKNKYKYASNKFQHMYDFYKINFNMTQRNFTAKFTQIKTKWFSIFQNNRKTLAFFFSLTTKRQYFLTRFFELFIKYNSKFFFKNYELRVGNILLNGRLALTLQHAKDLLFLGCVRVNAKSVNSFNFLLKSPDKIQLHWNEDFFINYQYLYIILKKKHKNVKYLFRRWYKHKYDFYKQHTYRFPAWLLKLLYFRIDVPKYLEVDYAILTIIVLRQPLFFYELNTYLYNYINMYLMRLYNWKYVT